MLRIYTFHIDRRIVEGLASDKRVLDQSQKEAGDLRVKRNAPNGPVDERILRSHAGERMDHGSAESGRRL